MDSGATVTFIRFVCFAYAEARDYDCSASDIPSFKAVKEPL